MQLDGLRTDPQPRELKKSKDYNRTDGQAKTNPLKTRAVLQEFHDSTKRESTAVEQLSRIWQEAKPSLEKELKDKSDLTVLKTFFLKVYAKDTNLFDQLQTGIFKTQKPFRELELEQQAKLVAASEFINPTCKENCTQSFEDLSKTEQEKLLSTLAFYQGTNRYVNLAVLSLGIKTNDFLESKLKAIFSKKSQFEALGLGATAFALRVKDPYQDYVLKLPIFFDCGSEVLINITHEENNLKKVSELLGNKKHQFQKLAFNAQGQYLGSKEILATEFLPGITLTSTAKEEDLRKYINQGLKNETILQFIKDYTKLAEAGVDLGDLNYQNLRYNEGELGFIDFAIPENIRSAEIDKHLSEVEELGKKDPTSACLRTLIQTILMFESVQTKFLTDRINPIAEKLGIDFAKSRFQQLQDCLKQAVMDDRYGLSHASLKKGIKTLLSLDPNNALILSPKAREYVQELDKLSASWGKPKQSFWGFIKQYLNPFNLFCKECF